MTNEQKKQTALDAFIARKAEIDEMLARLQVLVNEHLKLTRMTCTGGMLVILPGRPNSCVASPTGLFMKVNMLSEDAQGIVLSLC